MRIRKHRIAVLLLLSALPHLLADDLLSLMTVKDDDDDDDNVHLDLREQQQQHQQQESEEEPMPIETNDADQDVPSKDDCESSSQDPNEEADQQQQQQQQQQEIEPSSRPQQQPETGVGQQDEGILASSRDYENSRNKWEERIPKEYLSSLATDDSDSIAIDIDIDIDIDIERNEGDDTAGSAQDLPEDSEETASQAVHEDSFRLPTLSKIGVIDENYPGSEDDASILKSDIIETDDDDSSEEEETQPNKPLDSSIENNVDVIHEENYYDHAHTHIELSETAKELMLEEVVVEGDTLGSFGSMGTTNTDEAEVEDEEIVVLIDAKLTIGTTTTSIESIEDEEDEDDSSGVEILNSDGLVIDTELLEEKDGGSKSQNEDGDEIIDASLENATKETLADETDNSSATTEHSETVDDNSIVDGHGAEVHNSGEDGAMDSNTSAGREVDNKDGLEPSDDDNEKVEIEEEEDQQQPKIEDDDDEDDEDLTDRVSVDYASKSAGALIIEKTSEFKGTSNLITGDRDKYAIVPCSEEKKHVVLSLSEDILVKKIKLANYERFSSTVKDFQVKGSHTLGKWVDLGTYKAESGNGEQTFVLENPTWARYLKFRFLTHHGYEWYCTLSQIKVHGSNMVQGFHEQWESIEEVNNGEQLEVVDQSHDGTKLSNVDDSEKKSDADPNTKDTGEKVDTDENSSNSSAAPKHDPEISKEHGDLDAMENGDSGPRHAQVTPSVHSKPKPLDKFRNPKTFYEIIQGEMEDEKLFSDLYNLIPHTMDSLPAHSKNDLGSCKAEDSELRSVHQIGRLAMESLYSFGSRIVDDIALLVTDDADSNAIASPKMNEFSNKYYQKRFGSGLSSMIKLNANDILDPFSTKIKSSGNTITDGSTAGTDESSSTQQTNGTHEQTPGEVSETVGKSSANASVKETNDSLDGALVKLLKDLPSAECLVHLDFAEFKNKVSTTRKSTSATGGSPGGRLMEPIFKKLTDEIFALQTSLSVHDQFAKMSVSCYQRVILDLALETEKIRRNQEERLLRLEDQILEPASLQIFNKLVVSLVSTISTWFVSIGAQLLVAMKDIWVPKILRYCLSIATWFVSNGAQLFVTMKDSWVPKILRYCLSKETYEGYHKTFHTVLEQSSQVLQTLSAPLESNGWAKRATYQEFLSAWSTYYDGGMAVVATVLTLLFCRMLMLCSSFRRRKNNKNSKNKSSVRSTRKEPLRNGTTSSRATTKDYSEERVHKKTSRRKSKSHSKDPTSVQLVEDISTKPSEESIPKLEDEIPSKSNTTSTNRRVGCPTSNSPSVVSLEE